MITSIVRNVPDYVRSYTDSKILASRIMAYWHKRGYSRVKAWVESSKDSHSGKETHSVRSNISFNSKDAEMGRFLDGKI